MRFRTMTMLGALGLFVSLPSCGGSTAPSEVPLDYEPESPVELEAEQQTRVEELETALARTEPDCESVCLLGDRICELSERICAVSERHPEDADTRGRCRDGAERCDRAREHIAGSCPCAP